MDEKEQLSLFEGSLPVQVKRPPSDIISTAHREDALRRIRRLSEQLSGQDIGIVVAKLLLERGDIPRQKLIQIRDFLSATLMR